MEKAAQEIFTAILPESLKPADWATVNVQELSAKIKDHYAGVGKSDASHISGIREETKRNAIAEFTRKAVKELGLSEEEAKDKTFEDALKFGKSKFESGAKVLNTEEVNKLKAETAAYTNKIKELEAAVINTNSEWANRFQSEKITTGLTAVFSEIPFAIETAKAPIMQAVIQNILSSYDFDANLVPKTKQGTDVYTSDGAKKITNAKDLILSILEPMKVTKAANDSSANGAPKTVVSVIPNDPNLSHGMRLAMQQVNRLSK